MILEVKDLKADENMMATKDRLAQRYTNELLMRSAIEEVAPGALAEQGKCSQLYDSATGTRIDTRSGTVQVAH